MADDKFYTARVTKRTDFAHDLWSVRMDPGGEFKFTPGQYGTLGVERGDGKKTERAYSIVSSPYESELEFFFELVPEGALTPKLYQLQVGDTCSLRKVAKGKFTLDVESGHKHHLLVATVTGGAPYISYVRTMYKDWKEGKLSGDHKLYILFGASKSFEFGYEAELAKFAAEVPWLKFVPTVSRPWDDPAWQGEVGRVDELIRKYADMWGMDGKNDRAWQGHPETPRLPEREHARGSVLDPAQSRRDDLALGWAALCWTKNNQDHEFFFNGMEAVLRTGFHKDHRPTNHKTVFRLLIVARDPHPRPSSHYVINLVLLMGSLLVHSLFRNDIEPRTQRGYA
jgi:ferredoxin/flavodoxin---NADP+ reductase